MNRMIQLVFFSLLLSMFSSCINAAEIKLHNAEKIDMENIVAALPWTFKFSKEKINERQFALADTTPLPVELNRYLFQSKRPIQENSSGKTYLRITVHVGNYEGSEEALSVFRTLGNHAHPDIGLTYQWDFIALQGSKIYHLHADCLMASRYFTPLTDALIQHVTTENHLNIQVLTCRCGGGCS